MINAVDLRYMAECIDSEDEAEIDLLCACREYAISVASIQKRLTDDNEVEKYSIDPMALARFGRLMRQVRDVNTGRVDTGFELIAGVNC